MADDGEWSLQDCLSEPGLPQILVINPNSNRHMTQGLEMSLPSIRYVNPPAFYTGPRACPFSINNEDDAVISDKVISEVFARQSSSPALTRWDGYVRLFPQLFNLRVEEHHCSCGKVQWVVQVVLTQFIAFSWRATQRIHWSILYERYSQIVMLWAYSRRVSSRVRLLNDQQEMLHC